ncbi:uncharacterized protein LOC111712305, partial [Eurytemora carolleeae]|uniref:uncharacterized protein LOC111712305 n=1 Tax=Eurytemora carolleeae TaxID=1294199 RepID=UPI000C78F190
MSSEIELMPAVDIHITCCSDIRFGEKSEYNLDLKTSLCNTGFIRCNTGNLIGICKTVILKSDSTSTFMNQNDSLGQYSLIGVFQNESWLVSNKIGGVHGGVQNRGTSENLPYNLLTSWEYADLSTAGWQWRYDGTMELVCESEPCSKHKCGQNAICTQTTERRVCTCKEGFTGDPVFRCFPIEYDKQCDCKKLTVDSTGDSNLVQPNKMGEYFLYGTDQGSNVYQHVSGLEFLFQ